MLKVLLYAGGGVVALHGLIHLMGFVAYWPLATISELPYKTDLAGGQWQVGAAGMKLFALLWLIATLGFLAAAIGVLTHQGWWRPLMLGTLLLSTAIIGLDWGPAFRGAILNLLILMGTLLAARQ